MEEIENHKGMRIFSYFSYLQNIINQKQIEKFLPEKNQDSQNSVNDNQEVYEYLI
jgi:hypothetical protein